MSEKSARAISSCIDVGSIIEIDWDLLGFTSDSRIKSGFYTVVNIQPCSDRCFNSPACDFCKGYLTIQSVCDKKIYSRKCFGHSQTKSIFPFKSIRYYDTIDSEFDDLLKML